MKYIHLGLYLLYTYIGIFLNPGLAKASHVMGADMSWKCAGKDTFIVTVTLYGDCNGVNIISSPLLVTPDCGGSTFSFTSSIKAGTDITPVCKKSCTRCGSRSCNFAYGVREFIDVATVVLPSSSGCCKFNLAWEQCCRNSSISTGAAGQDFYCESQLNRCVTPCDNSPYFSNPPISIFCKNQCVVINPGANDDDRNSNGDADSVSFAFTPPLSGHGSAISYNKGYSYDVPLKYNGTSPSDPFNAPKCLGFHLNPITGDISFMATQTDVTVIALAVTEWRKDSSGVPRIIGYVRRDLQVIIIDCPDNHAPFVTTENNQTQFDFCAGKEACIKFYSFDSDTADSTILTWNNQLSYLGATFNLTKPNKPSHWQQGVFCWKPDISMIRSVPYQFVVSATDNVCPIPGHTSKTVQLFVHASPEAKYTAKVDTCGWVSFNAVRTGKDPGTYTYTWSGNGKLRPNGTQDIMYGTGASYRYKYTGGGLYNYSLTVASAITHCSTVYKDSIYINDYVGVDLPHDITVCHGDRINISAQRRSGTGNGTVKYHWNTGDTSISILPKIIRDTAFSVVIFDQTGCSNYDSIKVYDHPLPRPTLGPDLKRCGGDTIILMPGLKGVSKTDWFRYGSLGTVFLDTGNIYRTVDSGDYIVRVTDTLGCTGTDTIKTIFNPLLQVIKQNADVCRFGKITLDAGTGGAGAIFTWYDLTVSAIKPIYTGKTYTLQNIIGDKIYKVIAVQKLNGLLCTSTDTIYVHSHAKPDVIVRNIPAQCYGNPAINLSQYGDIPDSGIGVWSSPVHPNAIVSNVLYPDRLDIKDTNTIIYTVYNKYKCQSSRTVTVEIDTVSAVYAGPDTILCATTVYFPLKGSPPGGTWVGPGIKDSGVTGKCINPSALASGSPIQYMYTSIPNSKNKCGSTDTMIIRILPMPSIHTGKYGPLCTDSLLNTSIYLNKGQPSGGIWEQLKPGSSKTALLFDTTSRQYKFDPNLAGPGNYKLLYTATADGKHCPTSDTAFINVLPVPHFRLYLADSPYNYCIQHTPVPIYVEPANGSAQLSIDGNTGGQGLVDNLLYPAKAGPGIHYLRATYTDTNGCRNSTEVQIRIYDLPSSKITSPSTFCNDTKYRLSARASSADLFHWFTADGLGTFSHANDTITDFIPSQNQAAKGSFTVYFEDSLGSISCSKAVDSIKILIYPKPEIAFEASKIIGCKPLAVDFVSHTKISGNGIRNYIWDFGDSTKLSTSDSAVSHSYASAGSYTVTLSIVSVNGDCSSSLSKSAFIVVNPDPIPFFTAKPTFTTINDPVIQFMSFDENGNPLSNNVNDKTRYEWNFGDINIPGGGTSSEHNPIHTYQDSGMYTVSLKAINDNGCIGEDIQLNYIDIQPDVTIYIPNSFTPGNGSRSEVNKKFAVVISSYKSFEMKIFNRWGEQLYHTSNKDDGWDGTFQNKPCPDGVYIYVIKATSLYGREYTYTGSISLLRHN